MRRGSPIQVTVCSDTLNSIPSACHCPAHRAPPGKVAVVIPCLFTWLLTTTLPWSRLPRRRTHGAVRCYPAGWRYEGAEQLSRPASRGGHLGVGAGARIWPTPRLRAGPAARVRGASQAAHATGNPSQQDAARAWRVTRAAPRWRCAFCKGSPAHRAAVRHWPIHSICSRGARRTVYLLTAKSGDIFRVLVFFLISSGSPHVRPMGRTCGEPDEIGLTAMGVELNGSRRCTRCWPSR